MNALPFLIEIALYFAGLSLVAIGGASAVIPDLHRHLVQANAWMTGEEFAALVALAQAAPGPNVLIVAMLGWKLAGVPGGLVALLGMCVPSSLLSYHFAGFWMRLEGTRVRNLAQAVLVPVTIGLVLASAFLLARAADHTPLAYCATIAVAILAIKTKVHPLALLAGAGGLGAAGLL